MSKHQPGTRSDFDNLTGHSVTASGCAFRAGLTRVVTLLRMVARCPDKSQWTCLGLAVDSSGHQRKPVPPAPAGRGATRESRGRVFDFGPDFANCHLLI